MYEDKELKQLLSTGGIEKASPAFTSNVMRGIKQMQTAKFIREPLVPAYWIKMYRLVFISVISLLLLVTLINELSAFSLDINVQMPVFIKEYAGDIFLYIIAFWSLIWFKQKLTSTQKNIHLN